MVKIALTPDWFLGKDITIEIFSLIVLLTFAVIAYRYYKLSKNKGVFYLGSGFGLIALAQVATVLTKFVLYYDVGPSRVIGQAIITSHVLSSVDIFYYAGFFFYKFLTLLGLYVIYRLPSEKKSFGDYLLMAYFIIISAVLSDELFYIFHLTAFVLLTMIVGNYIRVYRKNRFFNTKLLIIAFSILALSQLVFVLSEIGIFFVVGDLVELISYTIFLAIIIRIWKYGKKTKPYGDNIRYAGNNPRKKRNN